MKNIKRVIIFTTIVMLALSLTLTVSANSAPPAPLLFFSFSNLPGGIVYADLLIKINPDDPKYTPLNTQNLEYYNFSAESDIVLYNQDDFRSFTFHYKDSASSIEIGGDHGYGRRGSVIFGYNREFGEFFNQFEDLMKNYREVKLAFLDHEGAIVSISNAFLLPKETKFLNFQNHLTYDYLTGKVVPLRSVNPWFVMFSIFITGFFVGLSIGVEVLTAVLFRFKSGKKLEFIALVNFGTQLIMRFFYILLPLPHILSIILLEILVYSSEFYIYRKSKTMADEKTVKLLIYTIVANTLSLVAAIFLRGLTAWHQAF
ncbi:MAG: hypothetical protein FWH20_04430 [Oscillospiraceae bacterium]|nr:hypothetical protein [Oscillospiraceae bacterium]